MRIRLVGHGDHIHKMVRCAAFKCLMPNGSEMVHPDVDSVAFYRTDVGADVFHLDCYTDDRFGKYLGEDVGKT